MSFSPPLRALALVLALLAPAHADDGPALQRQINEAIAAHRLTLTIAPGTYRLDLPAGVGSHLAVSHAKGLRIEASHVRLICTSPAPAILFDQCEATEVDGMVIDYDPLPFTQGVITQIAADFSSFVVAIDAGYPYPLAMKGRGDWRAIIIDPHTLLPKTDTKARYDGAVSALAEGSVQYAGKPTRDATAVGDAVALSGPVEISHAVVLRHCRQMIFDGLTVSTSPEFAVMEDGCQGSVYRHVSVVPGPPPAGATKPRLLSSVADGIHSRNADRGPLIEQSTFRATGDDGIAIHGEFSFVTDFNAPAGHGAATVVISPKTEQNFQVGDRLRFYDPQLHRVGEARIVSIHEAPSTGLATQKKFRPGLKMQDGFFSQAFAINIDQSLPLQVGDLVSSPEHDGSGFIVRNNVVSNTRARGIRIKCSEGLIAGNTIRDIALSAIGISPEPSTWFESDFASDLQIVGNTITNTGFGWANQKNILNAGAIALAAAGPAPAGGHCHILIDKNTITDAVGVNILVTSARDVTIRNNHFIHPNQTKAKTGSQAGVDGSALVWITASDHVQLSGNTFSNRGPFGGPTVEITPTALNVEGVANGVVSEDNEASRAAN